jgi:hypothetical protein
MLFVHGHEACVNNQCPLFGVNQVDCCDGENAESVPTAAVAAVHLPPEQPEEEDEDKR